MPVQGRVHPHHRLPRPVHTEPSPPASTPPLAGSTSTTTDACTRLSEQRDARVSVVRLDRGRATPYRRGVPLSVAKTPGSSSRTTVNYIVRNSDSENGLSLVSLEPVV